MWVFEHSCDLVLKAFIAMFPEMSKVTLVFWETLLLSVMWVEATWVVEDMNKCDWFDIGENEINVNCVW